MANSKRTTQADVIRTVLSRIEGGRCLPGARIIPATIAADLGISTIPVREALSQLVGRELLVDRHREGFHVAPLDGVTLGALYAEHGQLMDRAIAIGQGDARSPSRSGNPWRIFQMIAEQTGNDAITGIQRYLAARLLPARRRETAYPGIATATRDLWTELRRRNPEKVRDASREFHRICATEATRIAG